MIIGDRIKMLREKNKLTQEELAKYIYSTKQTIYKYENNIITNIPSDKVESIAKALGTSPSYLMGWEEISLSGRTLETLKELDKLIEYKKPTREETAVAANLFLEKNSIDLKDIPKEHYDNIISLIDLFKKVDELEFEERIKLRDYINKLDSEQGASITQFPKKEDIKEHLIVNAAHTIEGSTEEDKKHDDDIMDDPDF